MRTMIDKAPKGMMIVMITGIANNPATKTIPMRNALIQFSIKPTFSQRTGKLTLA